MLVTEHPDGSITRGLSSGLLHFADDNPERRVSLKDPSVRFPDDITLALSPGMDPSYAADAVHITRAALTLDSFDASSVFGWSEATFYHLANTTPMALVASCPVMMVAGIAPSVAFMPVGAAASLSIATITYYCLRIRTRTDGLVSLCYTLPFGALLACSIVYPLVLEHKLTADTTGEWAKVMAPFWVLSFLFSVVFPMIFLGSMVTEWKFTKDCTWTMVFVFLALFLCAACGIFNFGLIGLCFNASGEWTFMSYTGYASIIGGCAAMIPLLSIVIVLFVDEFQ